jgi:DNA polymerase III subunit epsilon
VSLALQTSFDDLGAPLFEVPFCVLDLETTGGSPADCGITEIGAVKVRHGELLGTFHTLVDPGTPIPPFITILTGITHAMVVQAPSIETALPSFLEFIGDAVVVGHNVRFDLSFIRAAALALGYQPLANRWVDTAALARRLWREEVPNLRLATLAAHVRSPVTPIHRALEDATATLHVLYGLLERAGTIGVTVLEDLLQLPTARGAPHYRKIRLGDRLPRLPGVYLFRDRNGAVIYVGKAKNLRTRVRSYFYGDERRSIAAMLRELESIDHRVCHSELDAEVTELRMIHEHRPRYNRRSRPCAAHWVRLTDDRFPRLSLARTVKQQALLHLGPFRSRRAAEMVLTALWDAVPIRRCSGKPGSRDGSCAPAQMGVARCPCDGSLDEGDYREVIDLVIEAVERQPALLLDRLVEKMQHHAGEQRFEEAGWLRDRHRALARSLERRRAWRSMVQAGTVWAQGADGSGAAVDRGRLVAAWNGDQPLIATPSATDTPPPEVPLGVGEAEEAHLVWKWLEAPGTRLLDVSGLLALPASPIGAI